MEKPSKLAGILTSLALAALSLLASPAWAQTRLWIQSDPGDYIGQGITATYTAPTDSFSVTSRSSSGITLQVTSGATNWTLTLAAPGAGILGAGPYENAARAAFAGPSPGLEFTGNGRGCNMITGRFVVLAASFDGSGSISSLAADFQQYCDGAPALWGELRYNSPLPLTVEKAAGWTVPDNFTFGGQRELAPSTQLISSSTTIYGINSPAPISITGGEYSKNGGAFTTAAGTVNNKDTIQVRATSSPNPGGTTTATVNVGGVTGAFVLVNYNTGDLQTGMWLQSFPGDFVGGGQTTYAHAPDWTFNPSFSSTFSLNGNGPQSTFYDLSLHAAGSAPLAPGAYEDAARAPFAGASPGIDFSLGGRGCNEIFGRFAVLEYDVAQQKLALDFEQWCDGDAQPLIGEIRINSAVPFSFQVGPGDSQPDPMGFEPTGPVRPSSTQYSNQTRVYGVNAPVPVSIVGGEYSVNDGPYTSSPGTVNQYDLLSVRVKSSAVPGGARQATLNAGGTTATFSVTTYSRSTPVSGVAYQSSPGDFIGGGINATFLAPLNGISVQSSFSNTVAVNLNGVGGIGYTASFEAPSGTILAPGDYENATRWPFEAAGAPGLDFSGDGRGCNQSYGRFVVYEAVYSAGSIVRFAADFEQHCESPTAPVLRGQVRYNSTVPFAFMLSSMRPQDMSGDGKDDIVWTHSDGRTAIWLMNGVTPSGSAEVLGAGTGWSVTHLADFDADGATDLLWQHPDGRMAIWTMNGTTPTSTQQLLNAGSGWHVTHVGDFNGDGKADLVFANTDGSVAIWTMNGTAMSAGATILGPGTGWSVAKIADFDGDGNSDILWVHADGRAAIWLMNGTVVKATSQILNAGGGWNPVQVGDLNGDGRADIVWQNTDGRVAAWLMNGTTLLSGSDLLPAGTGWSVAKMGDFDGDGKVDLLFQHTDGRVAIWIMNGTVPTSTSQIINAGSPWTVARVADLDGDGRSDIIWRNSDGRYAAWLMMGGALASGSEILPPGTGWSVTSAAQ